MMSHKLTIDLPDGLYSRIADAARSLDRSPGDIAAGMLAKADVPSVPTQESRDATGRGGSIRRFFGSLGRPGGSSDNEDIDADLAREYAGLSSEDA